ncbi:MAG: phosphopentomutase [Syntrophomonadaceae bacterium]|nr:phosphopentomutase [Syntrophomonadaceae bacterium]
MKKRVVIIVLDSAGVGAAPDSALYGDEKSNTLVNTAAFTGGLYLPNLQSLGLGNIETIAGVEQAADSKAAYGKMQERSRGKDTITGHWEMMGIVLEQPFPTYPKGFPASLIAEFEKKTGLKTLGNKAASGTEIIEELGNEHINTGYPIVYTSADSVFQIAAHEKVIAPEKLYNICRLAREMLRGEHSVGRVIARPFAGEQGSFYRTGGRRDYSLPPPESILQLLDNAGQKVAGVGKINDIFAGRGIHGSFGSSDNLEGLAHTAALLKSQDFDVIFTNLLDFDQKYGHRNDPKGYAGALEEFDRHIPEIIEVLADDDLLIITADHGCDPTQKHSTDHTREYVPLLVYSPRLRPGTALGLRETFADLGQTVADYFALAATAWPGRSFLPLLRGL